MEMSISTTMVTSFWGWASLHPILITLISLCVISSIFYLIKNMIRAINIANAGWPPNYLDADGDFKVEDTEDDIED